MVKNWNHLRKVGSERVRHVQYQWDEARVREPMDREEAMRDRINELNDEYRKGMKAAAVEQQNDIGKESCELSILGTKA